MNGGPGWRVSFGQDARAPGFEAVTGGADVLQGLEVNHAVAIVIGARIRSGTVGRGPAVASDSYLELAGDLGAQFRLGERARVRAGLDAGRAWLDGTRLGATLVGGWIALGLDLFAFARGRAATALTVRFDVGGFPDGNERFPGATIALCGGLGGRY